MAALADSGWDDELVRVRVEHRHAETRAVPPVLVCGVEVAPEVPRLEQTVVLLLGRALVVGVVRLRLGVAADLDVKARYSSVLLRAQDALFA